MKPRFPFLVSRSDLLQGLDQSPVNHYLRRNTDLLRSGIQTATKREISRLLRLSRHVSSVDSDGRRAREFELASHSFVLDEHFLDFFHETFCQQDIFDQAHRRWMRRAFRDI